MKIVLISTNSDLAGAPLHVKEVAISLFNNNNNVLVIFGSMGIVVDQLNSIGIRTLVIPGMYSRINPLADINIYKKLFQIIKDEQPDLIHCHSAKAGMIGRIVAWRLKVPVIYTVHGWGFGPGRKLLNSAILFIIEFILKSITNEYITVSDLDRINGIKTLGISPKKITTIHNGVSFTISDSKLRKADPIVIMVARNDYQKDYHTLAKALAISTINDALFVGKGTDESGFTSKMRGEIGGKCNVRYLGARTNVSELLESCSIFVLSSNYEALPLSIIEAMSKGLPIIASDVGGINELVRHGINGYLFNAGDHIALANYLEILKSNLDLRQSMGKNSLDFYRSQFTAEMMMLKLNGVYKKSLEKASHD